MLEKLSAPGAGVAPLLHRRRECRALAALGNTPVGKLTLVLRTPPQPWREDDSLLCVYAMWFELQDSTGSFELNRDAVRQSLGSATLDFPSAPRGNSWDAAYDDSAGSLAPARPCLTLRFVRPEPEKVEGTTSNDGSGRPTEPESRLVPGSNAFALAGPHTATGAALLANDMHLGLNVPTIWYRSVLKWHDARRCAPRGGRDVARHAAHCGRFKRPRSSPGVSPIPTSIPPISTFSPSPTVSPIPEVSHPARLERKSWTAPRRSKSRGSRSETITTRWTAWGPIIGDLTANRYTVHCWSAHDADATNLKLLELENAATAAEAVALAHHLGLPNQNMIVADADGHIAWTIAGLIPRRVGYDGRLPVSWAYGDRRWDGWLKSEEIPVILDPPDGLLWNGNNRTFGGKTYDLLGDSGYDNGARAGQIRDDLNALVASGKKAAPADLHAVQLDDRALFLERWQKLLLDVLTDDAVRQKSARAKLREVVRQWQGRAGTDSAAYRSVRAFRSHAWPNGPSRPLPNRPRPGAIVSATTRFPMKMRSGNSSMSNPSASSIPEHTTQLNSLLLAAADDVLADADDAGVSPAQFTWGRHNTLAMQHPLSRFLPKLLSRLIDMPAEQLPGDNDMPRVQGRDFGQTERLVVAPGHEEEGILTMPGGQSGHPLSPYYRASHEAWAQGQATPLLPGATQHTLVAETIGEKRSKTQMTKRQIFPAMAKINPGQRT